MTTLRQTRSSAIVVAIICVITSTTVAAEVMTRGPMTFEAFDRDGDGVVTEQEFYDARGQRMRERAMQGFPMFGAATAPTFEQIDSDGDDQVTPDEFADAQREHHQRMMQPR